MESQIELRRQRPALLTTFLALMLFLPAVFAEHAYAQSSAPTTSTWITNGTVRAIACTSTTIYIGGDFTQVGPATTTTGWLTRNCLAALDAQTGQATAWNPNVGGSNPPDVYSLAVSDGIVYVGGNFEYIGGKVRTALAALDASTGQVTAWNPNADGYVYTIVVSGSTVYLGGNFFRFTGVTRKYLAALDTATGGLTAWTPNANGKVYAVRVADGVIFAGGEFTNIGGQTRNRLAALDAATGQATAWNPNANGTVSALAVSSSTLFAAGSFTTIGGLSRSRLAALDPVSGLAQPWDAQANGTVNALLLSGSTLYAGGAFTAIGGQARGRLAALDATTAQATAWNPLADADVHALAIADPAILVGGSFTTIGGLPRKSLARFEPTPPLGAPSGPGATAIQPHSITWTWNDNATSETGFKIFADPGVTSPTTLRATAAANATSWTFTGLTPNTRYAFQAAATVGASDSARSALISRFTLAAPPAAGLNVQCNHTTGTAIAAATPLIFTNPAGFGPGTHGGNAFRVGKFRYAWDVATSHTFSGSEPLWSAGTLSRSSTLGGAYFLHLQSLNEEGAAGATLDLGPYRFTPPAAPLSSIPHASTWVTDGPTFGKGVCAIVCTEATVYIGGDFHKVGPAGTTAGWVDREGFAALDAQTGQATGLDLQLTDLHLQLKGGVNTMAAANGLLYIGGWFDEVSGQSRRGLASLNLATGQVTAWDPMPKRSAYYPGRYEIEKLTVTGRTVYVDGYYIEGPSEFDTWRFLWAFNDQTGQKIQFTTPDDTVNALVAANSTLYVGGKFKNIGGQARYGLSAIDTLIKQVTAWNPNPTGSYRYVNSLFIGTDVIFAGGSFSGIGGQPVRHGLAALDPVTGAATDWNPDPNGSVVDITAGNGALFAGGNFSVVGGKPRNNIAELDVASGLPSDWNPNANSTVSAVAVSGSSVYIGGAFTSIGGQAHPHFARFDRSPMDTPYDPGTTAIQSDRIIWTWRDNNTNETGFKVWADPGANPPATLRAITAANATSWTMAGLTPNTRYAFQVAATGSTGDSPRTPLITRYTQAAPPRVGRNVACDWTTGTLPQPVSTIIFTNPAGFGPGTHGGNPNRVNKFRYAWNKAATHTFDGTEAVWNGGSLEFSRQIRQFYTLHLQSLNEDGIVGGTLDYGPFDVGNYTVPNWTTNGTVYAIACTSTTIYIGGSFSKVGPANSSTDWVTRSRIAALDAKTGVVTAWNPNANQTVYALAASDGLVFAAGGFGSIGGQTRIGIAALDAATGMATSWNANSDQSIYELAISGSTVYAAGDFTSIGGQPRKWVAALNAKTGLATPWSPNLDYVVNAVAVSDGKVYLGGGFSRVGGQTRNCLAALDALSGDVTDWNPNISGGVSDLVVLDQVVYVGGGFWSIGGQTRRFLAALDSATGSVLDWNPNPNRSICDLAISGSTVFAGGYFTSIGGQARNKLAGLDAVTGSLTPLNPDIIGESSSIEALAISAGWLYAGGLFSNNDGISLNLERFNISPPPSAVRHWQPYR